MGTNNCLTRIQALGNWLWCSKMCATVSPGWGGNSWLDTEAKTYRQTYICIHCMHALVWSCMTTPPFKKDTYLTMSLVGSVIGVLSNNDNFNLNMTAHNQWENASISFAIARLATHFTHALTSSSAQTFVHVNTLCAAAKSTVQQKHIY